MTRSEWERRRAYRAYLERRRAEKRRRIIYAVLVGLIAVFLVGIILILARSCDTREEIPAGVTVTPPARTTAPETTTDPPETAPPETPPKADRPAADENTVTLTDEITSGYAVLIAPERGTVLAQKNAAARMYPASMTKIMTLLVAYEHIENPDEVFTVTNTIIDPLYRAEASLAGFSAGEEVTLRDLMYGTILPSGAEAAVSLAIYTAGSEEAFVALMNEKAEEMGLTDTHFMNCSGLHHKDHYSTAVEIAMILNYTMQYEECRTILSTYQYTTAPTNKHAEGVSMASTMFSRMYGNEPDGVTIRAGKTGYTNEAHQCLASYGEDDLTGEAYIVVTADAEGKFEPVFDAIKLYSEYTEK